ncbi:hypothetical protein TRFO_15325 [Tritrichomonas foetus]|uniref:At4g15545-like C-terminal domain-containing protein n=1 Tax=Tritrichomonas foetus TaxID=1144522 RepID=A0A1J4KX70_9EUKA|nr:hypothetical protein TRFO_15325 [Tritrichomonas foetus]|eukprot:OHT14302.1 hypothetical protein TRFO_15325 [Tritrichomonas foetus]
MQLDAEEELQASIDQVQRAAEQLKQQRSMEAKFWQKRIQELTESNDLLTNQVADLQAENRQLKADIQAQAAEIESLRALRTSLTRTLQSKEQEISRYISFNQNLKGLIDQQPLEQPIYTSADASFTTQQNSNLHNNNSFDTPKYTTTTTAAARMYGSPPKVGAVSAAGYRTSPISNLSSNSNSKPTSPTINTTTTSASKSSLFIQAAKEELTYSDFNQMINEIKLYNRHNQTREKTIENVRQLLCPAHRGLFDQFLPMISGI